jgi:hypothetical protein
MSVPGKGNAWANNKAHRRTHPVSRAQEYERATGIANQSTYWILFELLWRDFFRFFAAKHGNKIFLRGGPVDSDYRWSRDMTLFRRWVAGQTGVPFVDANMRELAATGFMSNRGRQNVASFLIHDMNIDWRLGAAFFESMLLDHDVCSNYGNWVSAAGLTGGRVNLFNVVKQALEYDPDGAFVRHWVPELARLAGASIHGPSRMSAADLAHHGIVIGTTYPAPVTRTRAPPPTLRDFRPQSAPVSAGPASAGGAAAADARKGPAPGVLAAANGSVKITDKRGGGRGARSVAQASGDLFDPKSIARAGPESAGARWSQKRYEPPARPFQPKSEFERFG